MRDPIYYWPVEMSKSNFPVQISKRFNSSSDNRNPNFALHWHEQLEFYYVVEGGIYLTCNGEEQWIYPRDIAFANWCDLHRSICFLDHTLYYVFQIDLSLLTSDKEDVFTEKYSNNLIVRSKISSGLFTRTLISPDYSRKSFRNMRRRILVLK